MDIREIFKPIESDLEEVEARLREASHAEFGPLATVIASVIGSGGKRIRPALVLLCGHFHPVDEEQLLRLATSVEMLHLAALIHDDLLDRSALRRGVATISSQWSEKATVLAGDFVMAKAAKIANEVHDFEVMSIFADAALVLCEGEIRQDFNGHGSPNRQDYYDRIYAKTASLFAACTESAAVLSKAPREERQALREYGYNLGMAFQITDDVLDFVGAQPELGKPVGNDLRQGVVTLPTIFFYEMDSRRHRLNSIIAHNGHTEPELEQVIDWIRASPAIGAAQAEAAKYARAAQGALNVLPDTPNRTALSQLTEYIVERKK